MLIIRPIHFYLGRRVINAKDVEKRVFEILYLDDLNQLIDARVAGEYWLTQK